MKKIIKAIAKELVQLEDDADFGYEMSCLVDYGEFCDYPEIDYKPLIEKYNLTKERVSQFNSEIMSLIKKHSEKSGGRGYNLWLDIRQLFLELYRNIDK